MVDIETLKAKQHLLQAQIESVKVTQLERTLVRERASLKLQDIADKQLNVKIKSEETKLATSEAKLQGLQSDLKRTLGETKFKQVSLGIQEHLWAIELTSEEFKLTQARQQLSDLKGAINILGGSLKEYSVNSLGGELTNV